MPAQPVSYPTKTNTFVAVTPSGFALDFLIRLTHGLYFLAKQMNRKTKTGSRKQDDDILDLMTPSILPGPRSSSQPRAKQSRPKPPLKAASATTSSRSALPRERHTGLRTTSSSTDHVLQAMQLDTERARVGSPGTPSGSSDAAPPGRAAKAGSDEAELQDLALDEATRQRILSTKADSLKRKKALMRARAVDRIARETRKLDPIFLKPSESLYVEEDENLKNTVAELFVVGLSKASRAHTSLKRWATWVKENAFRFKAGLNIAKYPKRGVLFEFFQHLHLQDSADSKGTGPANVRKGLRNAVLLLGAAIDLAVLDDTLIIAVAGIPEAKAQAHGLVDKATMSAFHQANGELIASGLRPTVAKEGEKTGFKWGPSPEWFISESEFWPDGGLNEIGLFIARAIAMKSIWNQRSIEFLCTQVMEVHDRDGDKPPFCRIYCDGSKGNRGVQDAKPYQSYVPLIGILPGSEVWMVAFAKSCLNQGPFVLRSFRAQTFHQGDPRYALKWTSGQEHDHTVMSETHLQTSWFSIMSFASSLPQKEMKERHMTPYATRMLGVTVGRYLRYPIETLNELGRWKPIEVSLSSGASRSQAPVTSEANGYSRDAGEAVELDCRIQWITDARRILKPFLDGSRDLPVDLFDMSVFAAAGSATSSANGAEHSSDATETESASVLMSTDSDDETWEDETEDMS